MPSLFCLFRFCLLLICHHDRLISSCIQFHKKAALREFDVYVEGSLAIINVDIFRAAPGKDVPYIVTLDTFVTDGAITIEFIAGISDPQINAIEVLTAGAPKSTPVAVPIAPPVTVPVKQPPVVIYPTAAPLALPPNSQPVPVPPTGTFKDIFINCGGKSYAAQNLTLVLLHTWEHHLT
jgi:Malectin domain